MTSVKGFPSKIDRFLPLNRLRVEETVYPDSNDVRPLLDVAIDYDQEVEAAMKQIFGKTPEQAQNITMKIHKDGQGIVGSYTHEVAEQKGIETTLLARQENFPLQVKVKKQ